MSSGVSPQASSRTKIKEEFREFVIVAIYLFVCFTALSYLKATILRAHGIPFAPFGFAAVKALICAKFISVGHALHIGERFQTHPLIWTTLYKSLAFLALLIVLSFVEEVSVGMLHHRTFWDAISDIGGGTIDQMIATCFIILLILIPYFAFRAVGEVIGDRTLVRLFIERRHNN